VKAEKMKLEKVKAEAIKDENLKTKKPAFAGFFVDVF
jgi:hypothetical protein